MPAEPSHIKLTAPAINLQGVCLEALLVRVLDEFRMLRVGRH